MRRSFLALAFLVLQAACSDGGDSPAAPGPGALGFEDIPAAEIVASDRAAVRSALQAARVEIRAIVARFRAGEITRSEARTEIQAIHDRLIESLGEFLTEAQIERLLHHRHPHPDLDLTDEQKRAIQALRVEFHAFVQDLRGRFRSGELAAEEARRLLRAEAHETRRELCAILTPSQQAKVPFCRGPEESGS